MEKENSILSQILGETEAHPYAELNGRKVYSFKDAQKINKRILTEEKLRGKDIDVGSRKMNQDGLSYNRTKAEAIAVNPDIMFANRYRVSKKTNGKPQIEVVLDYGCIKEQARNRVPVKNVPVFVLGKTGKNGNGVTLLRKDYISDTEFVNEFKKSIPIMADGGINSQIVAIKEAIKRADTKEEKIEDLEEFFG